MKNENEEWERDEEGEWDEETDTDETCREIIQFFFKMNNNRDNSEMETDDEELGGKQMSRTTAGTVRTMGATTNDDE